MPAPTVEQHIQRFESLRQDRGNWESTWEDIRLNMYPTARQLTGIETPGQRNRQKILDNSAESYGDNLSAAIASFLTNPATKWFTLRARPYALNDDRAVATWLATATEALLAIFEAPDTRFYTQMGEFYDDLVFFGTAGLWIADRPGKLPLFQHRPLAELFISEGADGTIDTVYRNARMTARQAVQFFNGNAGPKANAAAAVARQAEERFEFLHCIYPRTDYNPDSRLPRDLPIASEWIAVEDKIKLKVHGMHEMGMVVARWRTRDGEVYGRGPGQNALPDVKMLQRVNKATIQGAERAIKPPLMVGHDGVMTPVSAGLDAINVVRTDLLLNARRPLIEPINTGARPDLGEQYAETIRRRVAEAFLNHLVQMARDPRMTATQVLKLDEETLRVLGPVFGRQQSETHGPIIARTFGIAQRIPGLLPKPPEALLQGTIEVEYVSPMAKAQRLAEVAAISQYYDTTAAMRGEDPAIGDNVDGDATSRFVWERLGAPVHLLRDVKAVETRRKARQDAAEEEHQMALLAGGAKAAQSGTQALAALKDNMPAGGEAAA